MLIHLGSDSYPPCHLLVPSKHPSEMMEFARGEGRPPCIRWMPVAPHLPARGHCCAFPKVLAHAGEDAQPLAGASSPDLELLPQGLLSSRRAPQRVDTGSHGQLSSAS